MELFGNTVIELVRMDMIQGLVKPESSVLYGSDACTGCGKLISFFIWVYSYKKGSYLAAPCIMTTAFIELLKPLSVNTGHGVA
jgi:hypothetical protein